MLQLELAVGDCGGDEESAGLDAIRDDAMLAAGELLDAFDLDLGRAVALDLGAHLVEHFSTIDDFRLAGGADDRRVTLCKRRGAHDVDRPQNRGPLSPAEIHLAAFEA